MREDRTTRILIADEAVLQRKNIRKLLVESGFHVVGEVGVGDELLEKLERRPYDLLLFALQVPRRENLISCITTVHRDYPQLPIIALGPSNMGEAELQELVLMGVRDFVFTPPNPHKLVDAIAELLEEQRAAEILQDEATTEEK